MNRNISASLAALLISSFFSLACTSQVRADNGVVSSSELLPLQQRFAYQGTQAQENFFDALRQSAGKYRDNNDEFTRYGVKLADLTTQQRSKRDISLLAGVSRLSTKGSAGLEVVVKW